MAGRLHPTEVSVVHEGPQARVVSGAETLISCIAQRRGHLSLKPNSQKAPYGCALALIVWHLDMPSGV